MNEIELQKKIMQKIEKEKFFILDTHRNPVPGCPDFFVFQKNKSLPVELKRKGKKLNTYQENWRNIFLKKNNNAYIVIEKLDTFFYNIYVYISSNQLPFTFKKRKFIKIINLLSELFNKGF